MAASISVSASLWQAGSLLDALGLLGFRSSRNPDGGKALGYDVSPPRLGQEGSSSTQVLHLLRSRHLTLILKDLSCPEPLARLGGCSEILSPGSSTAHSVYTGTSGLQVLWGWELGQDPPPDTGTSRSRLLLQFPGSCDEPSVCHLRTFLLAFG